MYEDARSGPPSSAKFRCYIFWLNDEHLTERGSSMSDASRAITEIDYVIKDARGLPQAFDALISREGIPTSGYSIKRAVYYGVKKSA